MPGEVRRFGHDGVVMTLLELGADPAAAADDGRTPLHAACLGGFEVPPPQQPPPPPPVAAPLIHQPLMDVHRTAVSRVASHI